MTLPEAQQLRTVLFTAINTVAAGGISAYSINGRSATKFDLSKLLDDLSRLDNLIARLQNGVFTVAKFRCPE